VNSSQGGGSKDTWVLGRGTAPVSTSTGVHDVSTITAEQAAPVELAATGSPKLANVAPHGTSGPQYAPEDQLASSQQQQQQQQQQQAHKAAAGRAHQHDGGGIRAL
jgi:hypothetical protein